MISCRLQLQRIILVRWRFFCRVANSRFDPKIVKNAVYPKISFTKESFNDWGGRGYDGSVPGVVTKTATSEDRTARSSILSASLP